MLPSARCSSTLRLSQIVPLVNVPAGTTTVPPPAFSAPSIARWIAAALTIGLASTAAPKSRMSLRVPAAAAITPHVAAQAMTEKRASIPDLNNHFF